MNKTSNENINEVIELMKMFDVHILKKNLLKKSINRNVIIFPNATF